MARRDLSCSVQANKQIEQMVMFIKQEAEEKANEITMSAEEVKSLCTCAYKSYTVLCGVASAKQGLFLCRSSNWRS